MASRKSVTLFYDVISPYTWFAFEVLCRYQYRWHIDLKLRPFLLGGIMQGSGNKPPATNPNKGLYMYKDLEHCKNYFDVPLIGPKNPTEFLFEKGSLKAQRLLVAVEMKQHDKLEALTREFWMRGWSRNQDISEEDDLAEAASNVGINKKDFTDLLAHSKSQEIKDRLKDTTAEALDLGAFGSPMIVADVNGKREWIFGSDRFPILADILNEKWEGPNPGRSSKL